MTRALFRRSTPPPASTDGDGAADARPAPLARFSPGRVATARQRNLGWLLGGVLLVLLCALGGVLLVTAADDRSNVVVAAVDMERGEPIERSDMRVVRMRVDSGVATVSPSDAAELVGKAPLGPVPQGALLASEMFSSTSPLGADEVVVGAALDPGEAPMSAVAEGVGGRAALLAADTARGATVCPVVGTAGNGLGVGRRAARHRTDLLEPAGGRGDGAHRVPGRQGRRPSGGVVGMTTVVLGSVTGSPGVSTAGIGLAGVWPAGDAPAVLVEADPDGGRLGAELGVGVEPGLVSVALTARQPGCTGEDLIAHGAADVAGWRLIPGPASPEQAWSVLTRSAPLLARVMAASPDIGWVVDAGRLSTRSPSMPFATAADLVVLVAGGSFAELQLVPPRVAALAAAGCTVGLAVARDAPWPAPEIASFAGCDVVAMLPTVRVRPGTSRLMSGGEWAGWWSAVRDLAGYAQAFAGSAAAEVGS